MLTNQPIRKEVPKETILENNAGNNQELFDKSIVLDISGDTTLDSMLTCSIPQFEGISDLSAGIYYSWYIEDSLISQQQSLELTEGFLGKELRCQAYNINSDGSKEIVGAGFSSAIKAKNCGDYEHGSTKTRIRYADTLSFYTCEYETQSSTCNNGSFDEWDGVYTKENCETTELDTSQVSVTISPQKPFVFTDKLSCNVVRGEELPSGTVTYSWYVNGNVVKNHSAQFLTNSSFTVNDEVICIAHYSTPFFNFAEESENVKINHFQELDSIGVGHLVHIDLKYPYIFAAAESSHMLNIYDITNNLSPEYFGKIDFPGAINQVVVEGDTLFIAAETSGFYIYDISDMNDIKQINHTDLQDNVFWLEYHENTLYVAAGHYGVAIYDVTELEKPILIYNYNPAGHVRQVNLHNGYLYAVLDNIGLEVFDVGDLENINHIGLFNGVTNPFRVEFKNNRGYISDSGSGFHLINIEDPSAISKISSLTLSSSTRNIFIKDNYAYVGCWVSGMCVVDISDSNAISLVNTFDTWGYARAAINYNNSLYVADHAYGLTVFDMSQPDNLVFQSRNYQHAHNHDVILLDDNHIAVSEYNTGVGIYDISSGKLTQIDFINIIGSYFLKKYDNQLFVTSLGNGVVVLDVADPKNISQTKVIHTGAHSARQVVKQGNYLYLADYNFGVKVFNIEDINNPIMIGSHATLSEAFLLDIKDNILYVSSYNGKKIYLLDITDPTNPSLVKSMDFPDYVRGVNVHNNQLFVSNFANGVDVYSLADPSNPTNHYNIPIGGITQRLDIQNNHLFIPGSRSGGLSIYSLNDDLSGATLKHNHTLYSDFYKLIQVKDKVVSIGYRDGIRLFGNTEE